MIQAVASATLMPGTAALIAAYMPAACGAACDVPCNCLVAVVEARSAELIDVPPPPPGASKIGPAKFPGAPMFENPARVVPAESLRTELTFIA